MYKYNQYYLLTVSNKNCMMDKKQVKKNMEIDMSLLSSAQKQLCIKLLAQSSINFCQDKNGFSAQLKINPDDMPSQFFIQPKQNNQNSNTKSKQKGKLIKQKGKITPKVKAKTITQNISGKQNLNEIKRQKGQINAFKNQKEPNSSVLFNNNPKKQLSKLLKVKNLRTLTDLHPNVQLYIYPKKMTLNLLIQVIQTIYDSYWSYKNGRVTNTTKNKIQKNNKKNNLSGNYKKQRSIIFDNIQESSNHTSKLNSFPAWVYRNYVCQFSEKVKIEQTLVNLIQSLNHHSYKHKGIAIFYKFLSEEYSLQIFHYFLVIRALLEQVYEDKIIDKRCNYNSLSGYTFKLKINPYQKLIEEQTVYQFLQVCCCAQQKQSIKEDAKIHRLFQQMTKKMHFDQKKKKNYIYFFQMAEIFMEQFKNPSDLTNSNLQLSYSNNDSFNEFINIDATNEYKNDGIKDCEQSQIQSYFEVQNVYKNQQNSSILSFQDQKQGVLKLFDYYISRQPQVQQSFKQNFINSVKSSFQDIHQKMGIAKDQISQQSRLILTCLIDCLTTMNKSKWLQLIQKQSQSSCKKDNGNIGDSRTQLNESVQILFIQKLQQDYRSMLKSRVLQKNNIRKILTCSHLRISIMAQVRQQIA